MIVPFSNNYVVLLQLKKLQLLDNWLVVELIPNQQLGIWMGHISCLERQWTWTNHSKGFQRVRP